MQRLEKRNQPTQTRPWRIGRALP